MKNTKAENISWTNPFSKRYERKSPNKCSGLCLTINSRKKEWKTNIFR